MNKFLLYISLIFLSYSAFSQKLKELPLNAYHEGQVVVKLKEHLLEDQLLPAGVNRQLPSFLQKHGIESAHPLLPTSKQSLQRLGLNSAKSAKAKAIGLERIYQASLIKGRSVEEVVAELSLLEEVEYAEPLYKHELMYIPNDTDVPNMWHHQSNFFRIYDAWEVHKGSKDVVIGIIDTGAHTWHPDLVNKWHYNDLERYGVDGVDDDFNGYVDDSLGYDFASKTSIITDPYREKHGTSVSLTAGGEADNSFGAAGTGFDCLVSPLQVMTPQSTIINEYEAVLYAAENGYDIVNLSLGRVGSPAKYEQDVITYATEVHDVLIIAAAGNDGKDHRYYPASYEHVVSVAALHNRSFDAISWSTHNYWVDIAAPGYNVRTATQYNSNDYSVGFIGSSAAAPFVAGIAGLVRSAYPELKAGQVAAALRQTANNALYNYPLAQARFEKLGGGYVDAYAALTETMSRPAIFSQNVYKTNNNTLRGTEVWPGDTIHLSMDFINYLAETQQTEVILSSTSPYITILQSTYTLGALNTLEERSNTDTPFQIYVHPDTPVGTKAVFRLGYEDESIGYTDFQYVEIDITLGHLYATYVYMGASIGSNGRVGHIGEAGGLGGGIKYKGQQLIAESGLILATSEQQVSDAVRIDAQTKSADFTSEESPYFDYIDYSLREAAMYANFNDHKGSNPNPIGLDIEHRIVGWWDAPANYSYLLLEYDIQNPTSEDITNLYAGLYTDWDFGTNQPLYADWDEEGKFAYVYSTSGLYTALRPIHQDYTYYPIDLLAGDGNIDLRDIFSDAEKYQSMAMLPPSLEAGGASGSNIANVLGRKIDYLQAGASTKAAFVIMAGNSLEELRSISQASAEKLNARYQSPAVEISNDVFCPQDDLILSPDNEGIYKFYKDEALTDLLHVGSDYELHRSLLGKTLYVVNATNMLPSEPLAITPRLGVGRPGVPPKGVVAMSNFCKDNKDWMHYRANAGGATYFSINSEDDISEADVEIEITSLAAPGEPSYFPSESLVGAMNASYFLGKYWKMKGAGQQLDAPASIRIYYDQADINSVDQRAIQWASKVSGEKSEFVWFMSHNPNFDPEIHSDETGPTVPITELTPADYGIDRGVAYVEFSGIEELNGSIGGMINVGGVLPVKLTSFTAQNQNNQYIQLSWTTAQEKSNSHFEVQRSIGGSYFETIGSVAGNGDSDLTHHYSFKDNEAIVEGTLYYRLKQVDVQGTVSYSEVRHVKGLASSLESVQISPNPSQGELNIQWAQYTEGDIQVYNSLGQLVATEKAVNTPKQTINISHLPKGMYFIHLPKQASSRTMVWRVSLQP